MALSIRPQSVNVPLPRPRPDMGGMPDAPAVAAALPRPNPLRDPAAVTDTGAVPAADAVAADSSLQIPPADSADPYWGAVAAAAKGYTPQGESPFAALLGGFVTAQAESDRIESENAKAAREAAIEDRRLSWEGEDRGIAAEDRAYRRDFLEDDRDYSRSRDARTDEEKAAEREWERDKYEREFGLRENADSRAERADARSEQAFDYELLSAAAELEEKLAGGGEIKGDDILKLDQGAAASITRLRENQNDLGLSDEELSARIRRIEDNLNRAKSRYGMDSGYRNPDDLQIPENPGDYGANPGAVSTNNEPAMPKDDRAAGVKPSDVFPGKGELSGAGTPEDPIVGAPDDPEAARQWQKLYVPPGKVFVYRGKPYLAQ